MAAIRIAVAGLALVAVCAASAVAAPGVDKTTLQTQAFPPPAYTTVTVRTVVAPSGVIARHTHPGVEMAYLVSGRARVKIAGRPDQALGAGGSFSVPPNTPHSVENLGPGPLAIISTYVVDKTKPIASPAP